MTLVRTVPLGTSAIPTGALALLIPAGPLLLFPNQGSAAGLALLAPVFMLGLWRWLRSESRLARAADLAVLLLVVAGFIGTAIGARVVTEEMVSIPKLYGLLYAAGVYAGVRTAIRSNWTALLTAAVLAAGALAVAIVGFVGTEWLADYNKTALVSRLYDRIPRLISEVPSSTVVLAGFSPNEVSGVLVVLVPVMLSLTIVAIRGAALGAPGKRAVTVILTSALVLGLLVVLAYLTLGFSRTSWVALAGSLAVMLVAAFSWRGLALIVVIAVVAGGLIFSSPIDRANLATASDLFADSRSWGFPTRPEIWLRAITLLRQYPVTGIGLNTFPYVVQAQYPFTTGNEYLVPHAHNMILQVGLDYGALGLTSFLALVVLAAGGIIRTCGCAGTIRLLAIGCVGALAAYLTFGTIDAVAVGAKPTFLPFAVLALAVSLGELARAQPAGQDGPTS